MSYDGSMGVMNDQQQQQQQQHHVHEGNYTMPTHMDMGVPYPQNTPMHTHHSPPQQPHPHTVQDLVQGYNSFNNHQVYKLTTNISSSKLYFYTYLKMLCLGKDAKLLLNIPLCSFLSTKEFQYQILLCTTRKIILNVCYLNFSECSVY